MYRSAINKTSRKGQRGAALIVCLVLLLVLTIVGTASVEDINLQSNMARNSQFLMQAFNTALSESDGQISMDLLNNTVSAAGGKYTISDADLLMADDTSFDQTVEASYLGSTVSFSGSSMNQFHDFRFEINSVAELPNTGTRSDQIQGLSFTGAAAN